MKWLVVSALLASGTALADPVDANKGDAKELMQLGVKLVKSQDYLGALAVFKDAYKRFPSAKILLNIGTTLKLLERNADAANAYQRFLDSSDADTAKVGDVTAELAKLDVGLAKLAISAPPEAEIQVGEGDWMPATAAKLYRVTPGPFVVGARRTGYKPFHKGGDVPLGETLTVTVAMEINPEPVAQKIIVEVPVERSIEQPRSRLGAIAIGHFDVHGSGAGFVGGVFDITDRIAANGEVILGSNIGAYLGGSVALLTGSLRPIVSAGVPIFFNDGARIGIRGAVGLELLANRHFALIVELGVEHNFNPQQMVEFGGTLRNVEATSFIPALGATARL